MEKLQRSCQKSHEFPLNLIVNHDAVYDLNSKHDMLQRIAPNTFAEEARASLVFWELQQNGFQKTCTNNRQALRDHLNFPINAAQEAPLCRYAFVQANSSRTKLLLTIEMIMDLFTYFQVMASIIPMLASFGLDAEKDFQHCRFESLARLHSSEKGLEVPELKRSGRLIELAYTFRAVEPSASVPSMPWQIKQTCVYHSFDVITGLTTWIIIKGSEIVKNRIVDGGPRLNCVQTDQALVLGQAFSASLDTQLIFSDLSAEFWRDYINELERRVQETTRTMTFKPVVFPTVAVPTRIYDTNHRVSTLSLRERARTFTADQFSRSSTLRSFADRWTKDGPSPIPAAGTLALTSPPTTLQEQSSIDAIRSEEEAYFSSLQEINGLEERAYEAHLVLRTNVRIWKQLQKTYTEIEHDTCFPTPLGDQCRRPLKRFHGRLDSTQDVLEHHILRIENLITILSGRKTLLHSILEWRSMRSGNDLAVQATQSSLKMEEMTEQMQEIANRTEKETVSMRIITLVTMFFLPGTFISTLMSTDIVKFEDNQKKYSSSALRLFILVSLPMMAATFCAWYVVYWCANSREKLQRARKRLSSKTQV